MKNKKISLILICAMILNMFCTFTAFAAELSTVYVQDVNSAVTSILPGKNEGRIRATTLDNSASGSLAGENGESFYVGGNGWAEYKVNVANEGVYKITFLVELYNGNPALLSVYTYPSSRTIDTTNDKYISSDSASFSLSGSYFDPGKSIYLNKGENIIRIEGNSNQICIRDIKIETVSAENPVEFSVGTHVTTDKNIAPESSRGKVVVNAGGSFNIKINAIDAGEYTAYLNMTTAAQTTAKVLVGGTEAISAASIPAAQGYAKLGKITLAEGPNTITIKNTGSNQVELNKLKLVSGTAIEEQITSNPMYFDVNEETVAESTGATLGASSAQVNKDGTVTYTIGTEKAGDYALSLYGCTQAGASASVTVNDGTAKTVNMAATPNASSMDWSKLADNISLVAGVNTIVFKAVDGSMTISKFKLDFYKEEITSNPMEINLGRDNRKVDRYINAGENASSVSILRDGYAEYNINTEKAAEYKLYVSAGAMLSDRKINVTLDGTPVSSAKTLVNTGSHNTREYLYIGTVTFKPGENVICFQNVSDLNDKSTENHFTIDKFKLELVRESYIIEVDSKLSSTGTQYKQATLNVAQTGWYGVKLNAALAQNSTFKVTSGAQAFEKTVTSTGSDANYADAYLGKLYLKAGSNTVKVSSTDGSANVKTISLGSMMEELNSTEVEIPVNPSSVGYTTNYEENDEALSSSSSIDLRVGSESSNPDTSFTVGVYTDRALSYKLNASLVVPYQAMSMNVTVNGEKQIVSKDVLTNDNDLGIVTLKRGINELTFDADGKDAATAQDGIAQTLTVSGIKLTVVDDFEDIQYSADLMEGKSALDANVVYDADGGYGAFSEGSYVEYDIYSPVEAILNVKANANVTSETAEYTLSLNGVAQFTETLAQNDAYADMLSTQSFTIPAGYSTIRFTQKSGTANIKNLTFLYADLDELRIRSFGFKTQSGFDAPLVVTGGYDLYAVADLWKLGSNINDTVRLIVAQYDGDRLVKCAFNEVDFSALENFGSAELKTKLTLDDTGDTVKAFLVKADSIKPLTENLGYTQMYVLTNDQLQTLYNEEVEPQLAETVIKSGSTKYGTYHYNTSNGTVKAIFYDSAVGAQTKVFGYMGVPTKDANGNAVSESNPVPAVVLLHGGECKVDKTWVAKWVEKGYAAIALDLYGNGPDQVAHQYKGIEPWQPVMWTGVETAGMYQNTLNIIRAHNLIMSQPGVDETKTGLIGLSMGGITTATVMGIDTRFDVAVPIYGTTVNDVKEYGKTAPSYWDPMIYAAKADIPVMLLAGANDTNFNIIHHTLLADVLKNGTISIYQKLPHSDIAREFEQVYDYTINHFNGEDPYVKITGENIEGNVYTADVEVPEGTDVIKVFAYYTTVNTIVKGENNWQAIPASVGSDGKITVNIPQGATYCYASVHFTYDGKTFTADDSLTNVDDLVVTSKYLEVK